MPQSCLCCLKHLSHFSNLSPFIVTFVKKKPTPKTRTIISLVVLNLNIESSADYYLDNAVSLMRKRNFREQNVSETADTILAHRNATEVVVANSTTAFPRKGYTSSHIG